MDTTNMPTSRRAALAAGLTKYVADRPCKRGHTGAREFHTRKGCLSCVREHRQRQHGARVLTGEWLQSLLYAIAYARAAVDPDNRPAWDRLTHTMDAERLALVVAHVVTRPRRDNLPPSPLTVSDEIGRALLGKEHEQARTLGAALLGFAEGCGLVHPLTAVRRGARMLQNRVRLSAEAEAQRQDIERRLAASDIPPERALPEKPAPIVYVSKNFNGLTDPPTQPDTLAGPLDAIQSTAWHVNPFMLRTLSMLAARGPLSTDPDTHTASLAALEQALQCAELPRLYYRARFDWRGRLYQLGGRLQYTGGVDAARALLEFADGAPLTAEGSLWLTGHIATTYGVTGSVVERTEWTLRQDAQILAAAADPLGTQEFWANAKEPFQFLAACDAWRQHRKNRDALIHLPVAFDATASIFQNLAWLLRDRALGAKVNLAASGGTVAPKDIYTELSETTGETREDVKAAAWFFYGSTESALAQSYAGYLRGYPPEGSTPRTRARNVRRALQGAAPRAWALTEALQAMARATTNAGKLIEWRTPDGFHVIQDSRRAASHSIELWLWPGPWKLGARRQVLLDALDSRAQVRGIVANVVHSLDATMLRAVVRELSAALPGCPMGVAHDCFAVHPNSASAFKDGSARAIEAVYGPDTLKDLWAGWGEYAGEIVPHDPVLPVELVQGWWYMFS